VSEHLYKGQQREMRLLFITCPKVELRKNVLEVQIEKTAEGSIL